MMCRLMGINRNNYYKYYHVTSFLRHTLAGIPISSQNCSRHLLLHSNAVTLIDYFPLVDKKDILTIIRSWGHRF
jgi:hypothetical protein